MTVDLLSWPDVKDAEAAALDTRAAWSLAQRRYRIAPHGERQSRLRALQEAAEAALRADLELARVRSDLDG